MADALVPAPALPINPIIGVRPVEVAPAAQSIVQTQTPFAVLPTGMVIQGFVLKRDAKNNPVLRTAHGDVQLLSDVFFKTGSQVVFRLDPGSQHFARILSVDGMDLPDYVAQMPHGLTRDTVDSSPLPSTAAPPTPATDARAVPPQNHASLPALLLGKPHPQTVVSNPLITTFMERKFFPIAPELQRLPSGSTLTITLLDLQLPKLVPPPENAAQHVLSALHSTTTTPRAPSPPPQAQPTLPSPAPTPPSPAATTLPVTDAQPMPHLPTVSTPPPAFASMLPFQSAAPSHHLATSPPPVVAAPPSSLPAEGVAITQPAIARPASVAESQTAALPAHLSAQHMAHAVPVSPPPPTDILPTIAALGTTPATIASLLPSTPTVLPEAPTPVPLTTAPPLPTATSAPLQTPPTPTSTETRATASTTSPTTPQGVAAIVIGHEADGGSVLHTQLGVIKLFTSRPLPIGTTLVLDVSPSDAPIAQPSPQEISPITVRARDWPLLTDVSRMLQPTDAPALQSVMQQLPNAGPALASGLMFFIAAVKSGDPFAWLGARNAERLAVEFPKVAARLKLNLEQMQELWTRSPLQHWSGMLLPIQVQGQTEYAKLYLRDEDRAADKTQPGGGQRFVVDVELSHLGDMQFDGFVRKQDSKQFDLIVRTARPLDVTLAGEIRGIFDSAATETRTIGQLSFQTGLQHFVRPLAEMKAGSDNGAIVV